MNIQANISQGGFSFTTIVGVDEHHVKELELVWTTWKRFKPEIMQNPLLIVCDASLSVSEWNCKLKFLDHPDMRRVQWAMPGCPQREKMLNGITFAVASYVQTPWYLKLDTDTVATEEKKWIDPEWFRANEYGEYPVFVSHPWGYTKPPEAIDTLDQWAKQIPQLSEYEDLGIHPEPGRDKVIHSRITSWCYFGNTEWTQDILQCCTERLPVPSHDTFFWYCAERQKRFYRKVRMTKCGWKHLGRYSSLQKHFQNQLPPKVTQKSSRGCGCGCKKKQQVSFESQGILSNEAQREREGVVYLLCGTAHAVRLVVSIWSLRKYYTGPIMVFTIGEDSHAIGEKLSRDERLGVEHREFPQTMRKKNSAYLHKLAILQDLPFDKNVFLDADTLITGSIQELFDLSDENEMVATQFSNWTTERRTIQKRIKAWKELELEGRTKRRIHRLVRSALRARPAINCGVFGLRRNATITKKWYDLALIGRKTFICDEIALQLLLHYHSHQLLDCRWNCSPVFARETADVRIWHMHGSKHLRKNSVDIWWPAYQQVIQDDLGQIRDWTPSGDGRLEKYMVETQIATGALP